MATWFADYANIIFREFGSKVEVFTTLNEPKVFCFFSYVRGVHAPGKTLNTSAAYLCGQNALKAHARAYHSYDREYRSTQRGKIGIVTDCASYYPNSINETLAAEMCFQFECGWIAHPIFIGDYPEILKTTMAEFSRAAGLTESMLPELSPEWVEYIRNTSDYFGLNHYTSYVVEFGPYSNVSWKDYPQMFCIKTNPYWLSKTSYWLQKQPVVCTRWTGEAVMQTKERVQQPTYIIENGLPGSSKALNDYTRTKYHYSYLKELLLAVHRDGCNVQKYTVWSLMDSYEWTTGYDQKSFGLIHVNFSSPNRERTPRLSASWMKNVTRTRRLQPPILPPVSYNCSNVNHTICQLSKRLFNLEMSVSKYEFSVSFYM